MVYSTTRVPLAVAGANPESEMTKQADVRRHRGRGLRGRPIFFDYKRYLSWAPVLYVGSILLLLATLAIGRTTLGATSWIQVGSIEVEPAEVVKVTFIISLAALLASRKGNVTGRVIALVLALSVLPFLLIYKQDALGSAMVLAVVMIGMLLMAGTKGRHMVVLAVLAVVAIGGVSETGVLKQYQKDRLITFLTAPSGVATTNNASNPYAASIEYNLDQSKAAIADGGIGGKGPLQRPADQPVLRPQPGHGLHLHGHGGTVRLCRLSAAIGPVRGGGVAVMASSGRVAGPGGDADLRRGAGHAHVPGVRERRHDHGHHAGGRDHLAVHELRRVFDGCRLGGHRPGRQRGHAPFRLTTRDRRLMAAPLTGRCRFFGVAYRTLSCLSACP